MATAGGVDLHERLPQIQQHPVNLVHLVLLGHLRKVGELRGSEEEPVLMPATDVHAGAEAQRCNALFEKANSSIED